MTAKKDKDYKNHKHGSGKCFPCIPVSFPPFLSPFYSTRVKRNSNLVQARQSPSQPNRHHRTGSDTRGAGSTETHQQTTDGEATTGTHQPEPGHPEGPHPRVDGQEQVGRWADETLQAREGGHTGAHRAALPAAPQSRQSGHR